MFATIVVLWPLLTSHGSLLLQTSLSMRPPRVSVITFASYICCIYASKFGQYRTLFCVANSSVSKRLIYSFCSSDRGFAFDFLQTPPHDGRPCLWLTVPTAKPVADFHRQVITHAERTENTNTTAFWNCRVCIFYLIIKSTLFTQAQSNTDCHSSSCNRYLWNGQN